MAKITFKPTTLHVHKVRTSLVCEGCGGEDRNEFVGFSVNSHHPAGPIVLCHFCRGVLYKEIRANEHGEFR